MPPAQLARLLLRLWGWVLLIDAIGPAFEAAQFPHGDYFSTRGLGLLLLAALVFAAFMFVIGQDVVFRLVRWAGSVPGMAKFRVSVLAGVTVISVAALQLAVALVNVWAFPRLGNLPTSLPPPFFAALHAFLRALLPSVAISGALTTGPGCSILRDWRRPGQQLDARRRTSRDESRMPLPEVAVLLWLIVAYLLIFAPITPVEYAVELGPYFLMCRDWYGRLEFLLLFALSPALGLLLLALQRGRPPFILLPGHDASRRAGQLVASAAGLYLFCHTAIPLARETLQDSISYFGPQHLPLSALLPIGPFQVAFAEFMAFEILQLLAGLWLVFGLPRIALRRFRSNPTPAPPERP